MPAPDDELVLPCDDLDEAIAFFRDRLGLRLDLIAPADEPATAIMSRGEVRVRLDRGASEARFAPHREAIVVPDLVPAFVVTRADATSWHVGRAGMEYRDLLPTRLGGRFVASHIRIPTGGPVPDAVHYHRVRFQALYCRAGEVTVAYEDQGTPITLRPGDCVLQPPAIRHRVLECTDGLEVIEIGCPAVHDTCFDHELELPTATHRPERAWHGQRFVHHVAAEASGTMVGETEHRDLGIAAATNGLATMRVVRARGTTNVERAAKHELTFGFVLAGEITLRGTRLRSGDCWAIPPGDSYTLAATDAEWLSVGVTP